MSLNPPSNNDAVVINPKGSATPNTTYYCNSCNRKLFYREEDKETGKHVWFCTFCTMEVIPDNQLTKRKSVLKTAGPDVDFYGNVIENHIPPIVTIDDPNKELSSTTYKQTKLSPSFEALRKQGYKITSYEER